MEDYLGPNAIYSSLLYMYMTDNDWKSVLLLPPAQVKEKCAWWKGLVHKRGVWRFTIMAPGGLCAIMPGTCRMPQWSVVNWAMAELWLHLMLMEEEVVQYGMTMCVAMAVKPTSLSVPIVVLECISVATVKMQESSVQVSHTLMVSPTKQ